MFYEDVIDNVLDMIRDVYNDCQEDKTREQLDKLINDIDLYGFTLEPGLCFEP